MLVDSEKLPPNQIDLFDVPRTVVITDTPGEISDYIWQGILVGARRHFGVADKFYHVYKGDLC